MIETIYKDKRGRLHLKIVKKAGQYGPQYSAIVYRPYQTEDNDGAKAWTETHWMDEQDILSARRLHDIADDIIAGARQHDHLNSAEGE
ncbi:MAG: hypothetical protein KDA87_00545 [Planctomycetales bacterium]|nr:hypothetical protein [Planctomycetales bacterium]